MKKTINILRLSGSVLPTVLVVCTLMLLAVLALLGLSDVEALFNYGNRARRQKEIWLESAVLLYERDSTLLYRLNEANAFLLYEDDPSSIVTLSRSMWGLYELVSVTTDKGKVRKTCLLGLASESPRQAALYVPDTQRAFTLAGKSNMKGTLYLSENGLLYGQVQSDFYSGDQLPESQVRKSTRLFPELYDFMVDSLNALFYGSISAVEPEKIIESNCFFDPVILIRTDYLRGMTLRGNTIVHSPGKIEIDSTSRLNDILVVASEVVVREGFSGALQIIASDSIRIEKNVRLRYPSGLIIPAGNTDSYIEVEEESEVNGYVILRTIEEISSEKRTPHYLQHETSRVRGLLWIDGIAQVQGTVTGSLYANQANYYTQQGYYMNLLYNTSVYRSEAMAFPLWMKSNYQRKTIKWLD